MMIPWAFLILPILLTGTANGDSCGETRRFTKESITEYCDVNEHETPQDYEAHQRADASQAYADCVQAYGFVAVLDNPELPNITCVGAIISDRWVLDNCLETSKFKYQRISIGAVMSDPYVNRYRIQQTIRHKDYKRVQLTLKGFNTRYMYAANNALYLRKAKTKMDIPTGACAIRVYSSTELLPERGAYSVYMNKTGMRSKVMRISPNTCCNFHFQKYFTPGRQMCLQPSQFCVSAKGLTPSECCRSQAFMIYKYSLLGLMAWSTGCSAQAGIDPWVFSNMGYYLEWLRTNTNIRL